MTKPLHTHKELQERIRQLEDSGKEYERYFNGQIKAMYVIISDPAPAIKNLVHEFAKDKDFRKDLLKIGLSAGTNYLGSLLQSPRMREIMRSFIFKRSNAEDNAGSGLWSRLEKILSRFKTAKDEQ